MISGKCLMYIWHYVLILWFLMCNQVYWQTVYFSNLFLDKNLSDMKWKEYMTGFLFTYQLRRSLVKARKIKNKKFEYLEFDPYKILKLRYNLG